MSDHNTDPARVASDAPTEPFIDPDEARERPVSLPAAEGDGDATHGDQFTDDSGNTYEDGPPTGKEDGLPGEDGAIYQRGTTLLPPG